MVLLVADFAGIMLILSRDSYFYNLIVIRGSADLISEQS